MKCNMSSFENVYIEHSGNSESEIVCRGCFSTNKAMKNIDKDNLNSFLSEFADIYIPDNVGSWLCFQCEALLYKCVRFRRTIRNKHRILQEYAETKQKISKKVLLEDLSTVTSPTLIHNMCPSCPGTETAIIEIFPSCDDTESKPIADIEYKTNFAETIKEENEQVPCIKDEVFSSEQIHSPVPIDYDFDDNITPKEDTDENILKSDQKEMKKTRIRRKCRDKTLAGDSCTDRNDSHCLEEKQNNSSALCEETKTLPKQRKKPVPLILSESKISSIILTEEQYNIEQNNKRLSDTFLHFPFRCMDCVKGFHSEEKLKKHMKLHDKKLGPYECSICFMRFSEQSSMESHKTKHCVRYECQKCKHTSTEKLCALKHYRYRHENYIKPPRKERVHKPKKVLACDICGKTYSMEVALLNHKLLHTAPEELFVCHICGKSFAIKSLLRGHARRHRQATGEFYCVECDKFFKTEGILKAHLATTSKHVAADHKKHECDYCGREFQMLLSLRNHIQFFHSEKKTHQCKLCEQAFVTMSGLTRHVRCRHDKTPLPKKHICETCGQAFRMKFTLEEHKRIHTGEKPFKCEECGKCFRQGPTLRTHIKLVHLKLKRDYKKK